MPSITEDECVEPVSIECTVAFERLRNATAQCSFIGEVALARSPGPDCRIDDMLIEAPQGQAIEQRSVVARALEQAP